MSRIERLHNINQEIEEIKRRISTLIDDNFNIEEFNNLGLRIVELNLQIANINREIEGVLHNQGDAYSPPKHRRSMGDMRLFLFDGDELKCRNYIGIYNSNENIIEFRGTKYRSLSKFASRFFDYYVNGWTVVKKKRGNNWVSIDS